MGMTWIPVGAEVSVKGEGSVKVIVPTFMLDPLKLKFTLPVGSAAALNTPVCRTSTKACAIALPYGRLTARMAKGPEAKLTAVPAEGFPFPLYCDWTERRVQPDFEPE